MQQVQSPAAVASYIQQRHVEERKISQLHHQEDSRNASSLQQDNDSKLGRKGERPTVAQILEIGVQSTGQNWMDSQESVSR